MKKQKTLEEREQLVRDMIAEVRILSEPGSAAYNVTYKIENCFDEYLQRLKEILYGNKS